MRVGYWSPAAVMSLACCYVALVLFKPRQLEFRPSALEKLGEEDVYFWGMPKTTLLNLFVFAWGIAVKPHARMKIGSIGGPVFIFTGWSWSLLTFRAGLEVMAWTAATNDHHPLALMLATAGSSLRLATIINACIVSMIWNVFIEM